MTPPQQLELGITHHREGRLRDAEQIYRQILSAQPNNPDALHLLGVILGQTGQPQLAIDHITRAIKLQPGVPDYHANLGEYLRHAGKLDQSAVSFRQAIAMNANVPLYHNGLGVTLAKSQQFEPAIAEFRIAIQLKADYADAHKNLAGALREAGRLEESAAAYQQTLTLLPNDASAFNNLAIVLQKLHRPHEALSAFRRAAALNPANQEYLNNLGMMLRDLGQSDEALAIFRQLTSLYPERADYFYNMGVTLEDLARPVEALTAHQQALALKPDYPEAHMSSGMTHLLLGNFETGWKEYEWRAKCPHVIIRRNFAQPQWHGETLEGKTILLHAEQGLGDTLQFIRYATLLAKRGGKVIVEIWPELAGIIKSVEGIDQIIIQGDPPPSFDFHCPMMSLPLIFGTTLETIPAKPYLSAPPDRIAAWRERLGNPNGHRRVGLAWAGRPEQRDDRRRSMRLDQFAPLANAKSARFFSLQKGSAADQAASPPPGMNLIDWTPDLHNFVETAALLANLDLVICVCTAVAHLAGAIGKPVWVLLSYQSDWRWMLNRTDSPWYPTARLFRQKTMGDWTGVIAEVAGALKGQE